MNPVISFCRHIDASKSIQRLYVPYPEAPFKYYTPLHSSIAQATHKHEGLLNRNSINRRIEPADDQKLRAAKTV